MNTIQQFVVQWYSEISQISNVFSEPINHIRLYIHLPILVAFLLGLIGAFAPCQLTTNISALAFVSRKLHSDRIYKQTIAFIFGKLIMYTLMGGSIIFIGLKVAQFNSTSHFILIVRKLLGPLMIVMGLYLLGLFRSRLQIGQSLSERFKNKIRIQEGTVGSFLLGIVFSLAFCPTLFLLFFGTLIPLGMSSSGGVVFPAIFAFGTTFPLLLLTVLFASSAELVKHHLKRLRHLNSVISKVAAVILIFAGLNDTFLYWFL
ncbi:sulfite exporter TauE/SafE family protein [Fodinisporobacter ferrooxydans]|uniref:Sulfite exporter TauE/SafE family protein n=1 Tax=Fodinisporobacter ferrooxydans TaxID=2901836 RepID=A0ABY4CPP1_9BACL|nr:sulfite exporter TauE/SafE family protein [Alicyclobacillaceae bacterium MYW30-H2]